MKNRAGLERFVFWAFTTIVVLGFGTVFIMMAPSIKAAFEDDFALAVITGLMLLFIALNVLIAVFIYKDASRKK